MTPGLYGPTGVTPGGLTAFLSAASPIAMNAKKAANSLIGLSPFGFIDQSAAYTGQLPHSTWLLGRSSKAEIEVKGERYRPSQEHIRNFGLGPVAYTWEEGGPSLAAHRHEEPLEKAVEKLASLPFVDTL